MGFTYADAGVDIDKDEAAIKALIKGFRPRKGFGGPITTIKGFTGLIDFGKYALSMCTDGVGSKLMIAEAMNRWDTVGIDCIAMNANDMICIGAEPLAFVDYLAVRSPDQRIMKEIGKGLAKGARQANISIIGGEIATLPEIVNGLDLAGTCLGYVKKKDIIDSSRIRPGDVIVGLRSSGVHSNGYTLIRNIVKKKRLSYRKKYPGSKRKLGLELLVPTKMYVKEVLAAVRRFKVKGMANITGGGLRNLIRLRPDVGYEITNPFKPQPIFDLISSFGVDKKEMYQTFNMGMGFAMVLSKKEGKRMVDAMGRNARIVGKVAKGKGVTMGDLHYDRY